MKNSIISFYLKKGTVNLPTVKSKPPTLVEPSKNGRELLATDCRWSFMDFCLQQIKILREDTSSVIFLWTLLDLSLWEKDSKKKGVGWFEYQGIMNAFYPIWKSHQITDGKTRSRKICRNTDVALENCFLHICCFRLCQFVW